MAYLEIPRAVGGTLEEPRRFEVTRVLHELAESGSSSEERGAATGRIFALVYDELRAVASRIMSRERPGHTLQPTVLVHEAYMKLIDQESLRWNDRAHFLAIAARAMRQILIDYARRRGTDKRGGPWKRVTLDDEIALGPGPDLELLDLNSALERLAALDGRAAHVAELRLFGGLSVEEAAHVLSVSPRTIKADWAMARMWLSRELGPGAG